MRLRRWLVVAALGILAGVSVVIAGVNVAFSQSRIRDGIGRHFRGTVTIGSVRHSYFPSPGGVAENVVIRGQESESGPPLMSVQRFSIKGTYSDFVAGTKHIRVHIDGLRAYIPPQHSARDYWRQSGDDDIIIDDIGGSDLRLDLGRTGSPPLRFEVRSAEAGPIRPDRVLRFRVAGTNPLPRGVLYAEGQAGPWNQDGARSAPLSGWFRFENADLGTIPDLRGVVTTNGAFGGTVAHTSVKGELTARGFEVNSNGHPVDLRTHYSVTVDTSQGDLTIDDVVAQWAQTALRASGTIAGRRGSQGKTVDVNLSVRHGRIEDLMLLVMHSSPTLAGEVDFEGRAVWPPGPDRFLRRIGFTADFAIHHARFTRDKVQHNIDKLSERARGDKAPDPEVVLSGLKGNVELTRGIARFTDSVLAVPAAVIGFGGTADLVSTRVSLAGRLKMAATISQATTGIKSVFLKILDPLLRRRHAGAEIPVKLTGTMDHPKVGVDFAHLP